MPTLFTKIVNGEIPCHKIDENEDFLAFLDIRPINPGHCLCIPKKEVDYIFDVDDDTLKSLIVFSKKVAQKIEQAIDCKRIGVMVAGLEVPHCHIHLVPMNGLGDLNFANCKDTPQEELAATAAKINTA